MQVIYAKQPFPKQTKIGSIFLAGPTPRSKDVKSWRPEALQLLRKLGFQGEVYVPEPEDLDWRGEYTDQIDWEEQGLNRADVIVFWIPRAKDMLGLTTNDEWGNWKESGKVVLGTPPNAESVRYQEHYAVVYGAPVCHTLESTLEAAVTIIGKGTVRSGGEVFIPLHIWRTSAFQHWYKDLKSAGNQLQRATVSWVFRTKRTTEPTESDEATAPKKQKTEKWFVFLWVLKVEVFITKENRVKSNEFVLARPDISAIVLYHKRETLENTDVFLVREFRSPVSNPEGYVYEIPGGSIFSEEHVNPFEVAMEELEEETGFTVKDKQRLKEHSSRQLMSTLSAHKAHVFSLALTTEEFEKLSKQVQSKQPKGVLQDSERTYLEVKKVRDLYQHPCVDWSNMGMILSVLVPQFNTPTKK